MAYEIIIAGIDRTEDVKTGSVTIQDVINDQANVCYLSMVDLSGNGTPNTDDEIIIKVDGTKLFAGYVTSVEIVKQGLGGIEIRLNCVDYTYLLDSKLAHVTYTNKTDAYIINDLVNLYCAGFGITTTNVTEAVTISSIKFNYIQLSQALRRICELTGRNWYIDYDKDIHYTATLDVMSPVNNMESDNAAYTNLKINKNSNQLKNRVYVRGGTKLSDPTTYSVKGDGAAKQFPLPDKPHDVTVTVNSVSKTVGIKNINLTGYDWYVNFQEKYIEQDSGGSTLATTDTLEVTYTYDIPILVAVEDPTSIASNGVKEFAIFDKSINTTQAARDRASAELTDYANDIIEGSFNTLIPGVRTGQFQYINLPDYGIDDNYLVQRVVARSFGAGNFEYHVSIASAKTLGIIKFLIELLEANKNLIELNEDEVVDELFSLTDLLISDSLTDALTIDSTGPYHTWCTDDSQSTPITRGRWELSQWG